MTRILVVDNYDSFVYTLNAYLRQLGVHTHVVRNDEFDEVPFGYDGFVLSPGPGHPREAGVCNVVIEHAFREKKPLLGVCLGHQALVEFFGGVVDQSPYLMHGKTSLIEHDQNGLFYGVQSPLTVMRYHSLVAADQNISSVLQVTSRTQDGLVMSVEHTSAALCGVQFHPESIATDDGYKIITNWVAEVKAAEHNI